METNTIILLVGAAIILCELLWFVIMSIEGHYKNKHREKFEMTWEECEYLWDKLEVPTDYMWKEKGKMGWTLCIDNRYIEWKNQIKEIEKTRKRYNRLDKRIGRAMKNIGKEIKSIYA